MLDSIGCEHGLRSMWAEIPFHVGTCLGSAGQRDYCPAEFGIRGLLHAPVATVSPLNNARGPFGAS